MKERIVKYFVILMMCKRVDYCCWVVYVLVCNRNL